MMCVIIDACVRDLVFGPDPSDCATPVLNWIENSDGRLAYGGTKLCNELFKSYRAQRQIRVWKQAGRAIEFPRAAVDSETQRISELKIAISNDIHVIALARISGARSLFSLDAELHADFKNAQLIDNPRGTIYQQSEHAPLLKHTSSCKTAVANLKGALWA